MLVLQLTPWIEVDAVIRLVIAAVIGGFIGFERQRAGKPAGFRTHIMVGLGAALFTIVSTYGFSGPADPSRVAAAVVVGVGFLGAGTIIMNRETGSIVGLTTAASIWLVAAVGVATGAGLYIVAVAAAILAYIALRLPW